MTDTSTEAAYLIRKGRYWYLPHSSGCTTSAILAGRYTKEDADKITHPNGPDGPRNGMWFVHEDQIAADDWKAYRALAAERDALRAENEALREALSDHRSSDGVAAIAVERRRQVEQEGWAPSHDDQYTQGEIACAGACYALASTYTREGAYDAVLSIWPWSRDWLKPKSRREDLVRAGALIAAEIDRLDRAALKGGNNAT